MSIKLENITQKYDNTRAVNNLSLEIEEGELVSLLGPSGCGKTTLLRTIAGLIPLGKGKIFTDNIDISSLTAQKRDTIMVFQNYALFPNMNVEENLAYGLKIRGLDKKQIKNMVQSMLEKIELSAYSKRKITELSGGQQQRVALGRALIVRPKILLFDEPLSNLDEKLRVIMRREIRKIQKDFGITSIYVTHDQEEAMSISDRIVVMKDGEIQQIGKPIDVYMRPSNKFVADFMGIANFINFQTQKIDDRNSYLTLWNYTHTDRKISSDQIIENSKLMLRPENFKIKDSGRYRGYVDYVEVLGGITSLGITAYGENLTINFNTHSDILKNIYQGIKINFDVDLTNINFLTD